MCQGRGGAASQADEFISTLDAEGAAAPFFPPPPPLIETSPGPELQRLHGPWKPQASARHLSSTWPPTPSKPIAIPPPRRPSILLD